MALRFFTKRSSFGAAMICNFCEAKWIFMPRQRFSGLFWEPMSITCVAWHTSEGFPAFVPRDGPRAALHKLTSRRSEDGWLQIEGNFHSCWIRRSVCKSTWRRFYVFNLSSSNTRASSHEMWPQILSTVPRAMFYMVSVEIFWQPRQIIWRSVFFNL